jgi:hypothetical protein
VLLTVYCVVFGGVNSLRSRLALQCIIYVAISRLVLSLRKILSYCFLRYSVAIQTKLMFSWRYEMKREGPSFIFLQAKTFLGLYKSRCYRLPAAARNDCRLGNIGFTFTYKPT